MNSHHLLRRQFLARMALVPAAALGFRLPMAAAGPPTWTIGCFNRAWAGWSSEIALRSMRQAGYRVVGLISNQNDNPFALPSATPESVATLKSSLQAAELLANLVALRFNEEDSNEALEHSFRAQIENAHRIGVRYVMTFGVDKAPNRARYLRLLSKAAPWAGERGLEIVIKPHGGICATADDLQGCLDIVAHPSFKIWYDAGNIIHYTGRDPVKELKPIAKHVTGFCAKDCPRERGDVMIQFGTGKVDFKAVLAVLKEAGFNGPIMVEGLRVGATPEETTGFARANREFLEKTLMSL